MDALPFHQGRAGHIAEMPTWEHAVGGVEQ
jgi:hypothetical protein